MIGAMERLNLSMILVMNVACATQPRNALQDTEKGGAMRAAAGADELDDERRNAGSLFGHAGPLATTMMLMLAGLRCAAASGLLFSEMAVSVALLMGLCPRVWPPSWAGCRGVAEQATHRSRKSIGAARSSAPLPKRSNRPTGTMRAGRIVDKSGHAPASPYSPEWPWKSETQQS
jgi:hypothetical protein